MLKVNTFGLCQECAGTGCQNGTQPTQCPDCHGQGYAQRVVRTMLGQMMTTAPCERCEGHGTVIENPLHVSTSVMVVCAVTRNVGVSVPAGVTNNTRLRLANQGEVGENGGVAGDVYVDIRIKLRMTPSLVMMMICIVGSKCR